MLFLYYFYLYLFTCLQKKTKQQLLLRHFFYTYYIFVAIKRHSLKLIYACSTHTSKTNELTSQVKHFLVRGFLTLQQTKPSLNTRMNEKKSQQHFVPISFLLSFLLVLLLYENEIKNNLKTFSVASFL